DRLPLRLVHVDGAEPASPVRRFLAGPIEAAGDGMLATILRQSRIETGIVDLARRAGRKDLWQRRGSDRAFAGRLRPCGNQQRATVLNILRDVVVIEDRQHVAVRIAVEDDEVEVLDLLDEEFTRREGDQRQLVDRRTILLFRRTQNGEMDEVHRGVRLQQVAPSAFSGVGFAGDQQDAEVLADAVDDVDGAVVDGRDLAGYFGDG